MVVGGVLPSAPKKTLARFGERRAPTPQPATKAVQAEPTTVFPTYEKDGVAYYDLDAIYKDKGLLPVFIEQYPQSKEYFDALDKPPDPVAAAEESAQPIVIEDRPMGRKQAEERRHPDKTKKGQQAEKQHPESAIKKTSQYVQLATGEYVDRVMYDALLPNEQSELYNGGVEKFNEVRQAAYEIERAAYDAQVAEIAAQQAAFEANTMTLPSGDIISKDDYNKLGEDERQILFDEGLGALNNYLAVKGYAAVRALEAQKTAYDEAIAALPVEAQQFIAAYGIEAYNAQQKEKQNIIDKIIAANAIVPVEGGGDGVDIVAALASGAITTAELNSLGITDEQIRQAYNQQPGFNTIIAPIIPTGRVGGYLITPEMEELEPYVTDRSAGGQAQYNIQAYIQDKGVSAETISVLQGVGYSAPVINAMVSLAPYNGDIVQFTRENPQAASILTSAGFAPEAVAEAQEKAQLAPYYQDYESGYLQRQGITQAEIDLANKQERLQLGGMAAAASYGYRNPEEAEAQREAFLKVEQAKKAAYQEYVKEYGGESFAQSLAAMYVSPVFAAGRAFRPDVEIKDISGAEWALTAGQTLALAALPLAGISGVIAKGAQLAASAAFAGSTALRWGEMSPVERVANVTLDAIFVAMSLPIKGVFSKAIGSLKNISPSAARTLEAPLNNLNRAVRAGDAIAMKKTAQELEAYGLLMKAKGVPGAESIITRARDIIQKAKIITESEARLAQQAAEEVLRANKAYMKLPSWGRIDNALASAMNNKNPAAIRTAAREMESFASTLPPKTTGASQIIDRARNAMRAADVMEDALKVIAERQVLSGVTSPTGISMRDYSAKQAASIIDDVAMAQANLREITLVGDLRAANAVKAYRNYRASIRQYQFDNPTINSAAGVIDDISNATTKFKQLKPGQYQIADQQLSGIQQTWDDFARELERKSIGESAAIRAEELEELIKANTIDAFRAGKLKIDKLPSFLVDDVEQLYANKQWLLNAETQLTRTANPATRAAIQDQITQVKPMIAKTEARIRTLPKVMERDLLKDMRLAELLKPKGVTSLTTIAKATTKAKPIVGGLTKTALLSLVKSLSPMAKTQAQQWVNGGVASEPVALEIATAVKMDMKLDPIVANAIKIWLMANIEPSPVVVAQIQQALPVAEIAPFVDVSPITSIEPASATFEGVATAPADDIKTGTITEPLVQPAIKTAVMTQPVTETVTQTITAPQPITAIKTETITPVKGKTKFKPIIEIPGVETEKEKRKRFKGAITWKQGFGWWAIKEPYASQDDAAFFYKRPPPGARIVKGGAKSAYRSIQTITGKAPAQLIVDMGIMDVIIRQPDKSPGGKGDITFSPDNKQQTKGDIELKDEGLSMMRQPVVRPVPFTPIAPPVVKKAKKKKAKKKSSAQSLISQIIMGK